MSMPPGYLICRSGDVAWFGDWTVHDDERDVVVLHRVSGNERDVYHAYLYPEYPDGAARVTRYRDERPITNDRNITDEQRAGVIQLAREYIDR